MYVAVCLQSGVFIVRLCDQWPPANISDQVCVVAVIVCGLIVDSIAQLDL